MKATEEQVIRNLDADIAGVVRNLQSNPYSERNSLTLLTLAEARLEAVKKREQDIKMESES